MGLDRGACGRYADGIVSPIEPPPVTIDHQCTTKGKEDQEIEAEDDGCGDEHGDVVDHDTFQTVWLSDEAPLSCDAVERPPFRSFEGQWTDQGY